MTSIENHELTELNKDLHSRPDSEGKLNLQSRMGINALSNCLYEICSYLGENPLKFLERNSFYFNRKLENRKKYFLSISLNNHLSKAERGCASGLNDQLFEKNLTDIKNILLKENLIVKILRNILNKKEHFNKQMLYELIIPLRERINASEDKLDELFKFYCKNLSKRNPETLIKIFLDKLFNPKNFKMLSNLLRKNSNDFRAFYEMLPSAIVNSKGNFISESENKKALNAFVSKYYVEKMKNMYDTGMEFDKKQQQKIIC